MTGRATSANCANVIESMVVVDYDGVLDTDDLPTELAGGATAGPSPAGTAASDGGGGSLSGMVGQPLENIERLFISETLAFTGGNREQAAQMLGIGERTLYRKIKEWGL